MPTPTTREAYERLKADLERKERIDLPAIAQRIAEARAEGDLKENAEYHAQRENMSLLQAEITRLQARLGDCIIVDPDSLPKDRIVFGRKVTLLDLDEDAEEKYELVGPGEESFSGAVVKILATSPLALQLLNRKVGEEVQVDTPGGKIKYKVLVIE